MENDIAYPFTTLRPKDEPFGCYIIKTWALPYKHGFQLVGAKVQIRDDCAYEDRLYVARRIAQSYEAWIAGDTNKVDIPITRMRDLEKQRWGLMALS